MQALLTRLPSCSGSGGGAPRPACPQVGLGALHPPRLPAALDPGATPSCPPSLAALQRSESPAKGRLVALRAGGAGHDFSSDTEEYVEAQIGQVKHTDKFGHVIYLKLKDGRGSVLPVYIGDFECAALLKEIRKKSTVRPMTHDMMKNSLDLLGYKVSRVRVTALVGNTYHARVHFKRASENGSSEDEVDVDARPSDAINLAVRFDAPVFVNKGVAERMAHSVRGPEQPALDLVRSCREEMKHIEDPTVMVKLQLQMAIAEERYEDATRLRDQIEQMLSTDRALALVVALESALEGQRFEEAVTIRDELIKLRESSAETAKGKSQGES